MRQFVSYDVLFMFGIKTFTNDCYVSESKTANVFSCESPSGIEVRPHQKNGVQIDFKFPVVPEREVDVVNLDRRTGQGQGGQDRELDVTPQIHVPPPIAKGRPGHIASRITSFRPGLSFPPTSLAFSSAGTKPTRSRRSRSTRR